MAALFKKRDKVVKKVVEVEAETEEEVVEIPLIDRRDSQLTQAQIVEKDITLYDMLMAGVFNLVEASQIFSTIYIAKKTKIF